MYTMKKIVLSITIILIFLILIMGLNPVNSCNNVTNSSNWKNINISGVNFKLPPEYEGGNYTIEDTHDYYMLDTVFDFSIMPLNTNSSIKDIYGYESTIDELNSFEEETVGNHSVILLHSYRSIVKHNVTYAFFVVNKTMFSLSFNGNNLTANLKEMIKDTPSSKLSKREIYEILDHAQEDYLNEQEEYEEYYDYTENYRSSLKSKDKDNHRHDFAKYYIAYRIGQYFMNKKY